mgnify:CR=1 FL=1
MKAAALVIGGAALALAIAPAGATGWQVKQGEAQLARIIADRTAGAPVKCISTVSARPDALQVIDGVGVVFYGGKTIYVGRAAEPDKLRWTDVEALDQILPTRLCSTDRIWTHDKHTGALTGMVALTDFVPYTREG